jgi:hypothetical protein
MTCLARQGEHSCLKVNEQDGQVAIDVKNLMPKQVIVHAPFDVRLDDLPAVEQPLGEFEILARTEVSALSPGTETRIYTGLESERFSYRVHYPFSLGYNNVGRILAVGSKVQSYRVGQRVFSRMPHLSDYVVAERVAENNRENTNSNVPQSYDVIAPVPENYTQSLPPLIAGSTPSWSVPIRENVVSSASGLWAGCRAARAAGRVAAIGNSHGWKSRFMGADEGWLAGDDDRGKTALFSGEAIDLVLCTDAWSAMKTAGEIGAPEQWIAVLGYRSRTDRAIRSSRLISTPEFSYISLDTLGRYPPEYQRLYR